MKANRNFNQTSIEYEDKGNMGNNALEIRDIAINIGKSLKQNKIVIQNTEIYFPYTPYENQVIYMTKVIEALNKGKVAGLESPTGTGKTLCLLCACLGWLKAKRASMSMSLPTSKDNNTDKPEKPPKIFYSSRTHSQLSGVIKELKKTCYLPSTAILSSRDNMCVNSLINNFKGNSLTQKCKQIRYRKECKYFSGSERLPFSSYDNCDIEELNHAGLKGSFCPFFYERKKMEYADIVFLPYNYIFDSQIKSALKIKLAGSILIVDEAHNVESVCEDSVSAQLSTKTIDEILVDLKGVKALLCNSRTEMTNKESAFDQIDIKSIEDEEEILKSIKAYMKTLQIKKGKFWPDVGLILSPKEFFDIFFEGSKGKHLKERQSISNSTTTTNRTNNEDNSLTRENLTTHIDLLKKIEIGLADEYQKKSIILEYINLLSFVKQLADNHMNCIESNDENPLNNYCNNYKFFLNDIEDTFNYNSKHFNNQVKIRTLFLYCFNPGFGFKHILNEEISSIIITSGTLSPLEGIESELKCSFDTKLENKHVVDKAQVSFSILTNALHKKDIQFKFDASNKNNTPMIIELGNTIIELCNITPGGVLVFFTSYAFMNNCFDIWANRMLLTELEKVKEIYKDMHDNQKNKVVLRNYIDANQKDHKGKGAILFSVFRGTTSEGIDFSDDYARMAILVGIPYANLGDVRVQLKKGFLEEFNRKHFPFIQDKRIKKLTGQDWYSQTATRTVNQALGRVIRHVNDYGSIVLIDVRFREFLNKKMFPLWLKDLGRVYWDDKIIEDVKLFFEKMKTYFNRPKETLIDNNNDSYCKDNKENNNQIKDIEKYEDKYNKSNALAKPGWIKRSSNEGIQNSSGFLISDDIKFIIDYDSFVSTTDDCQFSIKDSNMDKNEIKRASFPKDNNIYKGDEDSNKVIIKSSVINEKTNRTILKSNKITIQYTNTSVIQEDNTAEIKEKSLNESKQEDHKETEKEEKKDDSIHSESEGIIKKLLELKDRSELNSLLEKYNMKLKYEEEKDDDLELEVEPKAINESKKNISSLSSSLITTKIDCPICLGESDEANEQIVLSSKCGHILCKSCWSKCLKRKKECPICKAKVYGKGSLTRLFIH